MVNSRSQVEYIVRQVLCEHDVIVKSLHARAAPRTQSESQLLLGRNFERNAIENIASSESPRRVPSCLDVI